MKHEIIKADNEYPFKTREELMKEDVIYPIGCFIQVKGENKRYVANGKDHFKDLTRCIDFPDDMEAYYSPYKGFIVKKK